MMARVLAVFLSSLVAGCGGDVMTSPESVRLEPSKAAHLRGPQTVALTNAYKTEFKREITAGRNTTRVVDFKELTENEIIVLRRALEDRGIKVSPAANKSIDLRVHPVVSIDILIGDVAATARLTLDAQFGDGTRTSVVGVATSGFGAERAFPAAMMSALHQLLVDRAFVDYINR